MAQKIHAAAGNVAYLSGQENSTGALELLIHKKMSGIVTCFASIN